ncbi:mogroside IE synthase [Quercus suber]|uniref:Udp-glycosyltransferase 74g1 n=1 Tax=Quercus suber TaxID=58331 RepID=A0AAW0L2Z6_QUESU|nr:udp-glycosyltransferase 74g1 [Quercus suber]
MERKTHILVIPYPVQGHINPTLQFSKRLATKGARVSTIRNSMQALQGASSVNIEIISDGSEGDETVESLIATVDRFKDVVSQSLAEYIEKLNSSKYPPKFIVYDCALPWVLDVARKYGIDGAPFYTQSCAVNVVYYHFKKGTVRLPLEEPTVSLPSMPKLAINDLSSLLFNQIKFLPTSTEPFSGSIFQLPRSKMDLFQLFQGVGTRGKFTIPLNIYLSLTFDL